MKTARGELSNLRARLVEAEETLRAIRGGEVDAVIVKGKQGSQVFTLEGADHAYRMLIESMNEGALMVTAEKTILYANQCFARMVKCPLEQVTGNSLRRFLSAEDRLRLRPLLQRSGKSGSKIQVLLQGSDGSQLPAHISIRPLDRHDTKKATFGMVVTDMTETQRNEERLRALTHRVVQVQESERGRVALELHDGITQSLCAILFSSQALAANLARQNSPARIEAVKLCEMAGKVAEEAERISRNLRPSVLDQLGLVAALRAAAAEFALRTGVRVKLACAPLTARLSAETELALYRILQEALRNVEKHARSRHVTIALKRPDAFVQLRIRDDGIGFDPNRRSAGKNAKDGLGLLGMRERAASVGGTLRVDSIRRGGTEIEARFPL